GVVILSPSFFGKEWPQWELDGLTARSIAGERNVILPVWHRVGRDDVASYSLPLANLAAARSADGVGAVADQIERVLDRLDAGEAPEKAVQGGAAGNEVGSAVPTSAAAAPDRPAMARRLTGELEEGEDLVGDALEAGRLWNPP